MGQEPKKKKNRNGVCCIPFWCNVSENGFQSL